jgi:hypothetical protein
MVTSSAVVGSSAIRSFGRQASAMAIMARCRIPPEKLCGCSPNRRLASGIRTSSRSRSVSASAAAASMPRWRRRTSATWNPTVRTGLRLVMGSWKIMPIAPPRTSRIAASSSASRSVPSSLTEPSMRPTPCWTSRMIESAVTDLPEPDSPTTATVSPLPMAKPTSRTTGSHAPSTRKEVVSPSTVKTGVLILHLSGAGRWRRAARRRGGSARRPRRGSQATGRAPARTSRGCSRSPLGSCRPRWRSVG